MEQRQQQQPEAIESPRLKKVLIISWDARAFVIGKRFDWAARRLCPPCYPSIKLISARSYSLTGNRQFVSFFFKRDDLLRGKGLINICIVSRLLFRCKDRGQTAPGTRTRCGVINYWRWIYEGSGDDFCLRGEIKWWYCICRELNSWIVVCSEPSLVYCENAITG